MTNKKEIPTEESVDPLDQTVFKLNEEQMEKFLAILDEPPVAKPKLAKLLSVTAPWEKPKD